jgi:peptidoglycan/LPS O-acetylase OafA/YrhL
MTTLGLREYAAMRCARKIVVRSRHRRRRVASFIGRGTRGLENAAKHYCMMFPTPWDSRPENRRSMPHAQVQERASLRYRADIDGLRAVAVVPVVFYHYGVGGFGGGFVGVDIFFVISGFLITSLIYAEMRQGAFSIAQFYERRARRILPALFAVMAASAVAAAVLLFPHDLMRFAESAASAALFGSNFDFWSQAGYFDSGAETKPLLHTWSLAVEEQFYLLFPALLYLLHTRTRSLLLGFVSLLALASFALSVWGVRAAPSAAFYLIPFRTWELMLGAILALGAIAVPRARWLRDALSLLGLAMIGWSIFAYTAQTRFPGEAALLPCLGAWLLIYAGAEDGTVQAVLSSRPFVFVGLISYSLYLWHWPLYVFARYVRIGPLPGWETAALIAASFALGVLSWRYVERPFRVDRARFTRARLFALGGGAMAVFAALFAIAFAGGGFPQRFSPAVQRIVAEADDFEPHRHGCFNRTPEQVARGAYCTLGDPRARQATILLWGDSHADAILPAVEAGARAAGRKMIFIGHGRCPPILHIELSDEPTARCARLNDEALALAMQPQIATVVLAARWAYYAEGTGYGPDAHETRRLSDLSGAGPGDADQHARFARMLAATVGALRAAHKQVVVVQDVPEIALPVPETLAREILYGGVADLRPSHAGYLRRQGFVRSDIAGLAGAAIVDPQPILCDAMSCAIERDGRPLYIDHHHLSVFGAMQLAGLFEKALAPARR